MLSKLVKAGKFMLGVVTAGIGVVAMIAGGATALASFGDDSSDEDEDDDE